VPRNAKFIEAEYAAYKGDGKSTISGQAFLKTRGGDVKYGAGNQVHLNPVTSYSTEWFERGIVGNEPLEKPDDRINPYHRTTVADGFGNFAFEHLPPGQYYVACLITWEVPNLWGGGLQTTGAWARAKVTVRDGESVKTIVTWNPADAPARPVEPSRSKED
jgi:hypothetical protein